MRPDLRRSAATRSALDADRVRRAQDFAVSDTQVRKAVRWVERMGLAPKLTADMTARTGRPRTLPWESLLTVLALAAIRLKGSLQLTDATLVATALTPSQRGLAGVPDNIAYWMVESGLADLAEAASPRIDPATGEVLSRHVLSMTLSDLVQHIVSASVPGFIPHPHTIALDSTDIETYCRRRSRSANGTPDVDDQHLPSGKLSRTTSSSASAGFPRKGADGRLIHTADLDVREGWRSAKEGATSIFLGWDLHLCVDVPQLGQEPIPSLVRACTLAPAGSSKTAAGRQALTHLATTQVVLADRGYSYRKDWGPTIHSLGMRSAFDLHTTQHGVRPGPRPGILVVDGGYYSDALPENLRNLDLYRPGMTAKEKLALASQYDARARYAFTPMGTPGANGRLRLRGPAITGRVRCRNHPGSMRLRRTPGHPTTACQANCGCNRTVTVALDDWSRLWQWPLYGTTAWLISYDRRVAVESTNAELKSNRFRLARGSIKVWGLARSSVLIGFILGALNMAIAGDWYGRDWTDLVDATEPPPKLARRVTTKVAKHRQVRSGAPPG